MVAMSTTGSNSPHFSAKQHLKQRAFVADFEDHGFAFALLGCIATGRSIGGWGFKRMRPQPGNALQEGREKKGDSDTDLRGEISVLLFFSSSSSSSSPRSGLWGILEKGGLGYRPAG